MSQQPLAATYPVLQHFVYNHLPDGPPKQMSRQFASLATTIAVANPIYKRDTDKALDRLLVAKDAAVRSVL